MARIRVLLAAMPTILSDIVQAVAAEAPDLEIVGHVGPEADLDAAVDAFVADVVVTTTTRTHPAVCERLLFKHPRLRVLSLMEGARIGTMDRLVPHRTVVNDIAPGELIDAILGIGRFS